MIRKWYVAFASRVVVTIETDQVGRTSSTRHLIGQCLTQIKRHPGASFTKVWWADIEIIVETIIAVIIILIIQSVRNFVNVTKAKVSWYLQNYELIGPLVPYRAQNWIVSNWVMSSHFFCETGPSWCQHAVNLRTYSFRLSQSPLQDLPATLTLRSSFHPLVAVACCF